MLGFWTFLEGIPVGVMDCFDTLTRCKDLVTNKLLRMEEAREQHY